jgi:hypothetical protein
MANLLQFEANHMERDIHKKSKSSINDNGHEDDFDGPSNGNQNNNKRSNKEKMQSFGSCCKKATKFIATHVGLIILVILYVIAGGFLFVLLESNRERQDCMEGQGQEAANVVNLKSQLLTYIQNNVTTNPLDTSLDNETVANANIDQWLQSFRDSVISLKGSYRYVGQDCSSQVWNIASGLLFAITIVTTIGYGWIAPWTVEGQIVCICYATIGIPLFLMCVANLSGVLGDMFRFTYAKICCRLCLRKKKPAAPPAAAAANPAVGTKDPGVVEEAMGAKGAKGAAANKAGPNAETKFSEVSDRSVTPAVLNGGKGAVGGAGTVGENDLAMSEAANVIEADEEEEEEERVTVPLTITMLVITGYVLIGGLLFNAFEGWGFIQSSYFCYVTLSTIGKFEIQYIFFFSITIILWNKRTKIRE